MYTIISLIVTVFIAVIEARGVDLQATISDDLPLKPPDLLSSLAAEITKSDVEITLGGLRVPEDVATDKIEAKDDSKHDKIQKKTAHLKSEQEAASRSSAEDAQKITHTSDDNASFIHVKEKIARQGSDEEYSDTNEQQKYGNTRDFIEDVEPKQASDDLKDAEESHADPAEEESKSANNKQVEVAEIDEKSDSVGTDDTQDLKSGAADEDVDPTMQSRRMLSFDHKVLDTVIIPKVESEPLLEGRSGQNNYEHAAADNRDHGHHDDHHRDNDNRHGGYALKTNPIAFPHLNVPTLTPLTLFHSPEQPLHPHFQPPDNIEKHSHLTDKSLLSPDFFKHLQERPHFDNTQNQHLNQHFKAVQQMFPDPYERMQPRQFHLPQNLQHEPPLQPSQPFSMFQPLQPSHSLHMSESWQPLQSFQSLHPQPSSQAPFSSSRSMSSFQPPQLKMDNIFSRLQDASQSQHPVQLEVSNQFSDLFPKNWNLVGYNSYSGG